jgi:hypothetical protein
MKKPLAILFLVLSVPFLFAAASAEGASSNYGEFMAGAGKIIPPDRISVEGYIAKIDYNYQAGPEGRVGLTVHNGYRQISSSGQKDYLHIGMKAPTIPFEDLPPLNLAFVIDISGSMNSENKLGWVKAAFGEFIQKIRPQDFVSLVVFESASEVVFPTTQMNSQDKKNRFIETVNALVTKGGTNLIAGLTDGYGQVLGNFRRDYENRVLFLTDGVGEEGNMLEMAAQYNEMGIHVSTIGVGTNFDAQSMVALAKAGGGSSRFILNEEEMKKIFSSELDRMIVGFGRNLQIEVSPPDGMRFTDAWGYDHEISPQWVKASLPTIHNGDYETLLVELEVPPGLTAGPREYPPVTMRYENQAGETIRVQSPPITVEVVNKAQPLSGPTNYTVLQSSTLKDIALDLIQIGDTFLKAQEIQNQSNSRREAVMLQQEWEPEATEEEKQAFWDAIDREEIQSLDQEWRGLLMEALEITRGARRNALDIQRRLDHQGLEQEITILTAYLDILGENLQMPEEEILVAQEETAPLTVLPEQDLLTNLESLFGELALYMAAEEGITLAMAPFPVKEEDTGSDLSLFIAEYAAVVLQGKAKIVDRASFERILDEQELSVSGLADTNNSIELGKLLAANRVLTGRILPFGSSLVIFARLIDVETSEVVAVSQVTIRMSEEISALL